jgi:Capsule polysaccharide biosynthesis protein
MINLLVEGRGELRKKVLDELVRIADGQIQLGLHFGDKDSDFHSACLSRMEVRLGKNGHLIRDHLSRGANIPLLSSPEFFKMLEIGIEQFHRNSSSYRYRSHNLTSIQDYLDYYHILSEAYAQEIESRGITHALFMNVPHLGPDMVLYQVAKAMGLKTLIISQTFFSDSFFSMSSIEDFGHLNPVAPSGPPVSIQKGSAPDLFYMNADWQKEGARGQLSWRTIVRCLEFVLRKQPAKVFDFPYLFRLISRAGQVYQSLPKWRDPFGKFFHENELAYFEHLAQFEGKNVDWQAKFVYVPLHNQPEMSTQSLGGLFRDQLLMVEAVARSLPEGWKIYVKDNPRQGAYARGPMFFHRLTRIKGVQLVPLDTSTYELSSNAQLTATVCGTAGWEAIRKGKPVLVFGGAWYKSFPGVFQWSENIDLEKIAAHRFDHSHLEAAAGHLQAACHPGIIEILYRDRDASYDGEKNVRIVAETVLKLLTNEKPVTFAKG